MCSILKEIYLKIIQEKSQRAFGFSWENSARDLLICLKIRKFPCAQTRHLKCDQYVMMLTADLLLSFHVVCDVREFSDLFVVTAV